MKCQIELAPDGALRLTTPSGRTLDFAPVPAAVALLQRTLYHAQEHAQQPTSYPTQSVLDAWARGRAIDWSRPEPSVLRRVVEILPTKKTKPKKSLKAFKSEKASAVAKIISGVNLEELDIAI